MPLSVVAKYQPMCGGKPQAIGVVETHLANVIVVEWILVVSVGYGVGGCYFNETSVTRVERF